MHNAAKTYNDWAKPQLTVAQHLSNLVDFQKNMKTLDAGCGTGLLSKLLIKRFPKIKLTGLDYSESMLCEYRVINNKAIYGNLERMPHISSNSFDYVVSSFALHWTDLSLSLAEIYRIVRTKIYLAFPVSESLHNIFGEKPHFPFPDVCSVKLLLQNLGLKIVHTQIVHIPIVYYGINLIRHFRYTGTRVPYLYPDANKWLRTWLKKSSQDQYQYVILYIICTK